ncbi:MAG: 2-hydroxyacid dehydrogenase [Actinomycetota bacterium]|nr:2-hydroxyacid dehydrogenase [Actinomycetota bacterium]
MLPTRDILTGIGALPPGLTAGVWEGTEDPPDLDEVEFYVPAYLSRSAVFAAMARMPRLQVCQTLTAGVDNVVEHLPAGVTLCNARGVHDASTAELAVGLMLASQRRLPDFVRAQDSGRWEQGESPSLADRRVLIVGYGSIGAAIERRLAGFEVEVVRVARSARDGVNGLEDLPALLTGADVVVVVVPLTDATRGLVDAAFLARMPDGALLVNVARGPVVDTGALLAELTAGRLRAALDVTDPEPLPPGHALWSAPGLIVTPHVGGYTSAFLPRAVRLVADQVVRWAAGEPLSNVMVDGQSAG